jgi:L-iditol 2-dehydrogenase
LEEAVPAHMMGYSATGDVTKIGGQVQDIEIGDMVKAVGPHAQYITASPTAEIIDVALMPQGMSYERGTFLMLATNALMWARTTPIECGDTVVVVGQGVVGLLYSQAVRERHPGRVITIDTQESRCEVSSQVGADETINATKEDPVESIKDRTGGEGADVVVECVGGPAGIKSFNQSLEMTKQHGVIHLISRYQPGPVDGYGSVPMPSSLIQRKMLVSGIRIPGPRAEHQKDAGKMIMENLIQVDPLITHRIPWKQTPEAYHLLYNSPEKALGVIIDWDQ